MKVLVGAGGVVVLWTDGGFNRDMLGEHRGQEGGKRMCRRSGWTQARRVLLTAIIFGCVRKDV